MKLLIDIPKEFEQQFQADRFDDSLHRLSADAHLLVGLYEQETALMLSELFKNAVPIPPHGDLIERDGIKWIEEEFEERCHNDRWTVVEKIAYKAQVDKLPTIIPASEEGT